MKLLNSFLALCACVAPSFLLAQSPGVAGTWQGFAVRNAVQIPLTLEIEGTGSSLRVAFLIWWLRSTTSRGRSMRGLKAIR